MPCGFIADKIDAGLVQDSDNSIASVLDLVQSCTESIAGEINGVVQDCGNYISNELELPLH